MNKSSKTTRFIVLSILFHVFTFLGIKLYKTLDLQNQETQTEKKQQELEVTIETTETTSDELISQTSAKENVDNVSVDTTTQFTNPTHSNLLDLSKVSQTMNQSINESKNQPMNSSTTSQVSDEALKSLLTHSTVPKITSINKSKHSLSTFHQSEKKQKLKTTSISQPIPQSSGPTEQAISQTSETTDPSQSADLGNQPEDQDLLHNSSTSLNQESIAEEDLKKEEIAKAQAKKEVSEKIEADKLAAFQKEQAIKAEEARQNAEKMEAAKRAEEARLQKEQAEIEKRLKMRKEEEMKLSAAPPVEKGENSSSESPQKATPYPINSEEIKPMGELKALPNNPIPKYTKEERIRGDKGTAVYHAFINSEGIPTQFKMIESTGHKNLDDKTLKSLKQWKFSPGQEGWAELSFKWNLEGKAETIHYNNRTNTRTAESRTQGE